MSPLVIPEHLFIVVTPLRMSMDLGDWPCEPVSLSLGLGCVGLVVLTLSHKHRHRVLSPDRTLRILLPLPLPPLTVTPHNGAGLRSAAPATWSGARRPSCRPPQCHGDPHAGPTSATETLMQAPPVPPVHHLCCYLQLTAISDNIASALTLIIWQRQCQSPIPITIVH